MCDDAKARGTEMTKPSQKPEDVDQADGTRVGDSPIPGLTLRRILRGHTEAIGRMAWSPDGRFLASPSGDQTVRIWDSQKGTFDILYQSSKGQEFRATAWSPDSQLLAVASGAPGSITIISVLPPWRVEREFSDPAAILDISWSPDGDFLIANNKVWSVKRSGPPIQTAEIGEKIYGLSWSPDGRYIAVALDKTLEIRDSKSLKLEWTHSQGDTFVNEVDWSNDGQLLAVALAGP
jgi:WD40 repeat protein